MENKIVVKTMFFFFPPTIMSSFVQGEKGKASFQKRCLSCCAINWVYGVGKIICGYESELKDVFTNKNVGLDVVYFKRNSKVNNIHALQMLWFAFRFLVGIRKMPLRIFSEKVVIDKKCVEGIRVTICLNSNLESESKNLEYPLELVEPEDFIMNGGKR